MALTSVVSVPSWAAATLPWRSGVSQLRVPPWLIPSRSPEGLTMLSVVVPPELAIRVTVSEGPT